MKSSTPVERLIALGEKSSSYQEREAIMAAIQLQSLTAAAKTSLTRVEGVIALAGKAATSEERRAIVTTAQLLLCKDDKESQLEEN